MKYSFDTRIRYSETDENCVLKTDALVNYLQDVTIFHAEDAGIGVKYLKENHLAWLLSSWQIDIIRMPRLGEAVRTTTWTYEFKRFFGLRSFTMTAPDGSMYTEANGVFVLFDMERQRPVSVPERDRLLYGLEPRMDMEYLPRKIEVFSEGAKETQGDPFRVERQHLDTNHHVNNGQYILMAQAYLPEGFTPVRIRAEYLRQGYLGAQIIPVARQKEETIQICLDGTDGKPYAIVEFSKAVSADSQDGTDHISGK